MTTYAGLSNLPPGSTGNANEKMGPKGLPASAFGKVTMPLSHSIQERASSVIINPTADAIFAFLYETTASIGGASYNEGYVSGSKIMADGGSLSLPIQPVAWKRTDAAGAKGDVTFVYRGGL
jgi:hypothetical protein